MSKVLFLIFAPLLFAGPAEPQSAPIYLPLEKDNPAPKLQVEQNHGQPFIVINVNFNIGHNDVSTIAPTASFGTKNRVEKVKLHILKLVKKHDSFRALIQDNDDGTSEWKDIQIDGLKYASDDDVAWHYREYDVFLDGKIVRKDRVLSVHAASYNSVLNAQDGAAFP